MEAEIKSQPLFGQINALEAEGQPFILVKKFMFHDKGSLSPYEVNRTF